MNPSTLTQSQPTRVSNTHHVHSSKMEYHIAGWDILSKFRGLAFWIAAAQPVIEVTRQTMCLITRTHCTSPDGNIYCIVIILENDQHACTHNQVRRGAHSNGHFALGISHSPNPASRNSTGSIHSLHTQLYRRTNSISHNKNEETTKTALSTPEL